MKRFFCIPAVLAALALSLFALPASAEIGLGQARGFVPHELIVKVEGQPAKTVELRDGLGVGVAAQALNDKARVEYAAPNYIATASATPVPFVLPNDPGNIGGPAEAASAPGDWTLKQWNFLPYEAAAGSKLTTSPGGIDVVGAWENLAAAGRPGGQGVTVAVLDTGIAYRNYETTLNQGLSFLRSPDFTAAQFVKGYDFVENDRIPLDLNGHGTHVAGTIAEKTDNGIGLTGIAYRAKLMPVRVLDSQGRGDAAAIARGIRFAIANRAQVINMSFNFGCGKQVPGVNEALREAANKGIVVVASAGNLGAETCVSPPATGPRVIGVGGSTEGGCLGSYSLAGRGVDLLAPGGGTPIAGCPSISARPIYQVTLKPTSSHEFGVPSNYVGTSMAAAHVSGAAALVLASGLVKNKAGTKGRVDWVRRRLTGTARSLGLTSLQQGHGLIDIAAATSMRAARHR